MPSATLTPQDKTLIKTCLKGYEIFSATVVRLYINRGNWEYQNVMGAIVLHKDDQGAFYLRIIDLMNSKGILWETTLPKELDYAADLPFFHSFSSKGTMIGLSFAEENEAHSFYEKIQKRETLRSRKNQSPSREKEKEKDSASFSFFKFGAKKKKETKKFDKAMIGGPANFRHVGHIGYDPEKGFQSENLTPELRALFAQAGVTEEQLKNKKTAKIIAKFVEEHEEELKRVKEETAVSPQASSPSMDRRVVPPPPPQSRGQKGRGPPPPPPPSRKSGDMGTPVGAGPPPPPRRGEGGAAPPPRPPPRQAATMRVTSSSNVSPSVSAIFSTGGAPPPPPPPPTSNPMAPPPPPPVISTTSRQPEVQQDGRGDLLASIRNANASNLRKAAAIPHSTSLPNTTDHDDLLSSIRNAGGISSLKKVDKSATEAEKPAAEGGLANALAAALAQRNKAICDSDEESEDSWGDED